MRILAPDCFEQLVVAYKVGTSSLLLVFEIPGEGYGRNGRRKTDKNCS